MIKQNRINISSKDIKMMWKLSDLGEPICLGVVKRSEKFYGVYKMWYNYAINGYNYELLTSATTKTQACKKAKLIMVGYEMGQT